MSTGLQIKGHGDTGDRIPSSAASLVDQLLYRLCVKVDSAAERAGSLHAEAAKASVGQEERWLRFVAVADRIHAILLTRLEVFTSMDAFKNIAQTVSLELRGPQELGFHGRTTTLTVSQSPKRPAPMEFSFRVGHNDSIDTVVLDYCLRMLPIIIKFARHEPLIVPFDDVSKETISAWIDDKLVGFARTYLDVYFNDKYQRNTMEVDPVLGVRVPRGMAVSATLFDDRTYHFFTADFAQQFKKDASAYIQPTG